MFDPTSVRLRGPLADHGNRFWSALLDDGYSPLTAVNHLRLAADFSRWLYDHRLGLTDLSDEMVDVFLKNRKRRGTARTARRAALSTAGHRHGIRRAGRRDSADKLLAAHVEHLARDRRLCGATVAAYVKTAREFATACFGSRDPQWGQLSAEVVTDFVMRETRRRSSTFVKNQIPKLRSFLRFLHVQGYSAVGLAGCVPAIAGWRLASVPPALDPEQIGRLLHVFDDRSPTARRNAAIVHLLLGLALRAGDVAGLKLEDVDWRAGEITVCGKGKHLSRLPLPHDVGRALAGYLRCRPRARTRCVFLRSRAPCEALTSGGVVSIAKTALRAAGVAAGGAHLLCHTAATQMLRKGASLSEIAHVLRHRHVDTTAIYAKVDLASLQSVARPWPDEAVQ
jgi:site-specific recombinase XerD